MTWKGTAEARTDARPAGVWATLLDGQRWSRWYDGVEWMVAEGPIASGTVMTVKPRRLPQTAFRIEDAVPNAVLGLAVRFGPVARLRLRWEIASNGAGSTVVQTVAHRRPSGRHSAAQERRTHRAHDGREPGTPRAARGGSRKRRARPVRPAALSI